MGKLVCPYCRTEATDAIGVKRREPRQKHYVFGMAEPYYMHSEGVPYSKKDTFKPKGGGKNPPACSPVSAGSSSTPSNGRSGAAPVTPWLQMPTAPEMCSSHSHGFGLRPLMFAQRHIFFRLRAFISGCLAALDAAPPFPARVMPMEIGISFSCPKKSAPAQPAPHAHMASAFGRRMFA